MNTALAARCCAAPTTVSAPHTGCRYKLNARDQIIEVDEGWIRFAEETGAGHLMPSRILHRSLWSFISDARLRLLQGELLRKVRSSRAPITLPFRCDAPDRERWMEMELRPEADRSIAIRTVVLREKPRAIVPFDPLRVATAAGVVQMCGWCNRVQMGHGTWQSVEELLRSRPGWPAAGEVVEVRHGLCSHCDGRLTEAAK